MQFKDTLQLAWQSVLQNKLRTAITVAIITFGLTALIGILTSIEAMKLKMKESFSFMGANSFTIRAKERKLNIGPRQTTMQRKENVVNNLPVPIISLNEAIAFKQQYEFAATVSISPNTQNVVAIKKDAKTTNPNINFLCGDEDYCAVNGYNIKWGRNFSKQEAEAGRAVCLIGMDVANKFFAINHAHAINEVIIINDKPYTVIGVLASKGSAAFFSFDNTIITSIAAAQKLFMYTKGYSIGIKVNEVHELQAAMNQSMGIFKSIRGKALNEEPNFAIEKSDRLSSILINATATITFAAIGIGLITLLGAAIGLMNIMLVTVNERTKEVGLVKSLGANNAAVQQQFLLESIIIAILGGVFGVIVGISMGNLVGYFLGVPFFIPWGWVMGGIVICTIAGLLAGLYPALKAAKLNPIQALRYE
jgi:putative ABC transport system permease protein